MRGDQLPPCLIVLILQNLSHQLQVFTDLSESKDTRPHLGPVLVGVHILKGSIEPGLGLMQQYQRLIIYIMFKT